MAGFYHLDHKEVIRVRVKKLDGKMQPEYKKFSIDPQITSFEILQGILARAFDINGDFTISYMTHDTKSQAVYLSMTSDWDMDAAFQCAAEPYLKLRVHLTPCEELADWDVIAPAEIPQHQLSGFLDRTSILRSITHNLGKTVDSVQRAMGLRHRETEVTKPTKAQMSQSEFCNYLDSSGLMIKPSEFRQSVFQGGIEPSFRRVAWRHLLNIYPTHMSSIDRFKYLEQKEREYQRLRDEWRDRLYSNTAMEEVEQVVCMVKKDVLRTDRSHDFYAGSDENPNIVSLFHILVTYALTHPDVSYCQGMSDLASPVLFTQKNEGHAYICFCALMNRLRDNFSSEGGAIMTKFRHLSDLLSLYDPVLYNHLMQNSAEDLFFCYRWFLLELKREFPFNDALYVLEVMWATLPSSPPESELALVDPDYCGWLQSTSPRSPKLSFQHAMYSRLLAVRRSSTLHRTSPKPRASPTPRSSVNNNLSTEPSQHNCSLSSNASSFDSSPGEGSDEFPNIENSLTNLLQQQTSKSINDALQNRQLCDNYNRGDRDNLTDNSDDVTSDCHGEVIRDERFWTFTHSYYSCRTRDYVLDDEHCRSCPHMMDMDHGMLGENNSDFHLTNLTCELDTGRRSWSLHSAGSEFSELGNQQTQFSLSLDSNANSSADVSCGTGELKNFISSTGSSESKSENTNKTLTSDSQNVDYSRSESSQGLLKQLLAPTKQPHVSSQLHELPPSSRASKQLLVNEVMSAGLPKNMSDSHISDCQEATEEFGSPDSTTSPSLGLSKLPPPQKLGAGNPFLMFLCVSLLVQHRDVILSQGMCYEEIAMHLDKLVRRHNANDVLPLARQLYTQYLRAWQANLEHASKDNHQSGLSC